MFDLLQHLVAGCVICLTTYIGYPLLAGLYIHPLIIFWFNPQISLWSHMPAELIHVPTPRHLSLTMHWIDRFELRHPVDEDCHDKIL